MHDARRTGKVTAHDAGDGSFDSEQFPIWVRSNNRAGIGLDDVKVGGPLEVLFDGLEDAATTAEVLSPSKRDLELAAGQEPASDGRTVIEVVIRSFHGHHEETRGECACGVRIARKGLAGSNESRAAHLPRASSIFRWGKHEEPLARGRWSAVEHP